MWKIPKLYPLLICIAAFIIISNINAHPVITGKKINELRIHHLPVGGGTCTLVECPGKNATNMLIDCGSSKNSRTTRDFEAHEVKQYISNNLPGYFDNPLDVMISHAHPDHFNYVDIVLGKVIANVVWLGGKRRKYEEIKNEAFTEWMSLQESNDVNIVSKKDIHWHNDRRPLEFSEYPESLNSVNCGLAEVYVLTVNSSDRNGDNEEKNGNSLVLSVNYKNFAAVFPGDAEGSTEHQAIENYKVNNHFSLDVDLLSASHHGGRSFGSNGISYQYKSSKWHKITNPKIVVHSAGTKYGLPNCKPVKQYTNSLAGTDPHFIRCADGRGKRYKAYITGKAEYVTGMNGAIIVTTDGDHEANVLCTGTYACNDDVIFEQKK